MAQEVLLNGYRIYSVDYPYNLYTYFNYLINNWTLWPSGLRRGIAIPGSSESTKFPVSSEA